MHNVLIVLWVLITISLCCGEVVTKELSASSRNRCGAFLFVLSCKGGSGSGEVFSPEAFAGFFSGLTMAFKVEISGIDELVSKVKQHESSQLPYIIAKTLTDTAKSAQAALIHEMKDVFDRPTPFILNSTYIKPATKSAHEAFVGIKDYAGKGNPADKVLQAEVFGGSRRLKRFERALRSVGVLPSNHYVVPGAAAKLDAHGNISSGQIIQILSYFKAFPEAGHRANMTDAKKAKMAKGSKRNHQGVAYFVSDGSRGRGLRAGIYARYGFARGSAVKPVMLFVESAVYEKRFDIGEVVQITASQVMEQNFRKNWNAVMGSQ